MAIINAAIKRFSVPLKPVTKKRPFLSWIYAPSPEGFIFALRTTIASCIAIGIALWMELDSPAWAGMTVWAVAQLNRGESLSKARWRIIGTLIGALAAFVFMGLMPQSPWLFYPVIASWVGVCSGFATFCSNFRSYAFVLAGYTCAIICMAAVPDGNDLFMFAVSRASYIILGVVCETVIATIFSTDQEQHAHLKMRQKLESALILVSQTLVYVLGQDRIALTSARKQFGTILRINDEIEFSEIEMGAYGHEGDHARAALASVSALLSRGFGMATRLQLLTDEHPDFEVMTQEVLNFLSKFPKRLVKESELALLLEELQHLRDTCRQYASPMRLCVENPYQGQSVLTLAEAELLSSEDGVEVTTPELDERVLFVSLGELLGDFEQAITQYHASMHPIYGDHFRFNRHPSYDTKIAWHNGIRGALAIIITALIYEVTAWPSGTTFISLTSLICGLYATQENPVLGTTNFLKGTIVAWIVAWFLGFVFMPMVKTYEPLVIILGTAMFLGGLAKANPSTRRAAAAYCLLMPLMLGLHNHHVMDEVTYHNTNLAIVLAAVVSVGVFRSILPFDRDDERFRMRKTMLKELRSLANPNIAPQIGTWISHSTDRFSRLINHSEPSGSPLTEATIQGTLATLTLGLNIIRLRALMDREYLPESGRRPISLVLHYIERSTRNHARAARIARAAVRRLRELDTSEHDIITRLELTRALTYLVVIAHSLKTNSNFLDESRPFTGEGPRPSVHRHSFFFKKNSQIV
ncbi:FUSC family protein [Aristophania vespae]|uniref:FUSC family protein n=1 Tax=Aristophania vespae TaxID=2697033 RepID=A0A6P1NFP1_9PROT|nr:FUSC family protein [Aristophania vespae]QHI95727.1 FUSC family protein [Aristophania vespae]UMM63423.1 p-hydroxybenzoic acid efflux pump subunit AaeB [Aristophania vespae]